MSGSWEPEAGLSSLHHSSNRQRDSPLILWPFWPMTQHLVWVWLQWWTHSVFRITACWNQKGSKEGCWGTQGMGGGVRMQFWIFVSVDSSEKLRYKWTWPVITVSWKPTFKSTKEKLKGRVTKSSTASGVQLLRMRWWSEGHLQRRGNDLELETHFQMHLPLRDLGALCSCCWVASVNSGKKNRNPNRMELFREPHLLEVCG